MSEERDRRLASSGSSKYASPFTPGCDDLDAYGHWVDVIDYGAVWYPIVPAGWVPYRFGHWVWIDPGAGPGLKMKNGDFVPSTTAGGFISERLGVGYRHPWS